MILLTSVCCWHGITTVFGTHDSSNRVINLNTADDRDEDMERLGKIVDGAALCLFAAIYIVFNITFGILIYMKVSHVMY